MSVYLGSVSGNVVLFGERAALRFSVATAARLADTLKRLLALEQTAHGQAGPLALGRIDDQISISDGRVAIFVSVAGARAIVADLPRYSAIASALSRARRRQFRRSRRG